jgi:hypothetical protein
MEYDNKTLSWQLMAPLNRELSEIFDLIDYQTRFQLKLSSHAVDRMKERITKYDASRLGMLFKRIVTIGLCELLYFQTRYANGDSIGRVEFAIDDMVVPITFVADYAVLCTIILVEGDRPAHKYTQINLSNKRFNK